MKGYKYNRMEKKYRDTLLKLQILENMRTCAIFLQIPFRAADIKRYTSPDFIKYFELWQVAEFQIFGRGVLPEYFGFILDDEVLEGLKEGKPKGLSMQELKERANSERHLQDECL